MNEARIPRHIPKEERTDGIPERDLGNDKTLPTFEELEAGIAPEETPYEGGQSEHEWVIPMEAREAAAEDEDLDQEDQQHSKAA